MMIARTSGRGPSTVVLLLVLLLPFAAPGIVFAFPAELDLSDPAPEVFSDRLYGANLGWRSGDKAGTSLAVGDLDGDGLDDLVVGSPYAASEVDARVDSGVISILLGATLSALNGTLDLAAADCRLYGNVSGQLLGASLACGDLDGDGLDDIVAGAPGYGRKDPFGTAPPEEESYQGACYVIKGRPGGQFPEYSEVAQASRFFVLGSARNQQLGFFVAACDINGDGFEDAAVSALEKDPETMAVKWGGTGKVYIYPGSSDLPGGDLGIEDAGIRIYGTTQGEGAGYSLATGDVNGDGTDDLFIGAPYYAPYLTSEETGRAYGVFGGPDLPRNVTLDSADLVITGDRARTRLGHSLAVGDVDGDGGDDLVVGAPLQDAGAFTDAGMIYMFGGGAGLEGSLGPQESSMTFAGGGRGENAGTSLGFAGLGKKGPFLMVGAPNSNGSGPETSFAGKVYAVECQNEWASGTISLPEAASHIIYGSADGDLFGSAVGGIEVDDADGGTGSRFLASSPGSDGEYGSRPDCGTIYLFRASPKQAGGTGGQGNGTGGVEPEVDVPEGLTFRDGALLFGICAVVFLSFLALLAYNYFKRRGGGRSEEGDTGRGDRDAQKLPRGRG